MPRLTKTAISQGRLRLSQARKGRRPMSVDTFLRKEKEGTLYKEAAWGKKRKLDPIGTLKDLNREASDTIGLNVKNLLQRRTLGDEILGKMRHELENIEGLKLSEAHTDQLPGGLADDSEPQDFESDQVRKGVKVELEHTNSATTAKEIAMDHLKEFPRYYDELEDMERKLEQQKESGVLQQVGKVLTTPIPGTKPWLLQAADPAMRSTGKAALKGLRPATRTAGGVTTLGAGYERYLPKVAADMGAYENKLPWYTTAGLGTAGAMAGSALLPDKYKVLGALGGTLLGTGIGLEGGTALGKHIDQRKALRDPQVKAANSGGTMQRMFGEGASRGIDTYILNDFDLSGRPAVAPHRPGDAPSMDQAPGTKYPSAEYGPAMRDLDLAPKVAAVAGALGSALGRAIPKNAPPLPLRRLTQLAQKPVQQAAAAAPTPALRPVGRLPMPAAPRGYGANPTAPIIAQPGTLAAKKQTAYLQQRVKDVAGGELEPGAVGSVEWAERGAGFAPNASHNAVQLMNLDPQVRDTISQAAQQVGSKLRSTGGISPEQTYSLMADSARREAERAARRAARGVPERSEVLSMVGVPHLEFPSPSKLLRAPSAPAPRVDMATKVGGIAANELEFPTRDDEPERDQADVHRRERSTTQWAGADTPVPGYNPNWQKKAHIPLAMREELMKLCCVDEMTLFKLALEAPVEAPVEGPVKRTLAEQERGYAGAQDALKRLKELEEERPTAGDLARGATAGSIVGGTATLVNKAVAGTLHKPFGEAMKHYSESLKGSQPTTRGKLLALGKGTLRFGADLAGASAGSATFGATLPIVRGHIDRKAEIGRLNDYLETAPRSRLRRAASEYMGV